MSVGVCRQSQSTGLCMCIHENVVGLANLYAFSFMNILLAPSDDVRRSQIVLARPLTISAASVLIFSFECKTSAADIDTLMGALLKAAERQRAGERKRND